MTNDPLTTLVQQRNTKIAHAVNILLGEYTGCNVSYLYGMKFDRFLNLSIYDASQQGSKFLTRTIAQRKIDKFINSFASRNGEQY